MLIENEKVKYENISNKKEKSDELRLKNLENEKNISSLKASIIQMEEENVKLKKNS